MRPRQTFRRSTSLTRSSEQARLVARRPLIEGRAHVQLEGGCARQMLRRDYLSWARR